VSRWARFLPASGLLAAIALASTGLISSPPPIAGAPANDVALYFARHHIGLEIESVADCVGVTLLVIFAATLHAHIRTVPSMTAFAAAAIIAACTLVQVAAFEALAYRPDPEPVRAALLNDLQSLTFQVVTFPTMLFLGSAGTAILESKALPHWVGLAAVIAGCLQAVAWISFFAPPGILAAGGIPDVVAFTALLAWLLGCSLAMLRKRE
jgi:hypothetical protein